MSVTLKEVIESAGYDLSSTGDAIWLLARQAEFYRLCEQAEDLVNLYDEHNRFDDEHRLECDDCQRDYDDLCDECADEARLDNE